MLSTVMFRIVEDTEPPIPEKVSPLLDDFLRQCLRKDPASRPDAETLCEHEWLGKNFGYPKVCSSHCNCERMDLLMEFGSGTASAGQHPFPPSCQCGSQQKGCRIPPCFGRRIRGTQHSRSQRDTTYRRAPSYQAPTSHPCSYDRSRSRPPGGSGAFVRQSITQQT